MKLNVIPRQEVDPDVTRFYREVAQQVNAISEGKQVGFYQAATAAPTTGTAAYGDFVLNSAPVDLGGYFIHGWRCSVAGTPGTWLQCRFATTGGGVPDGDKGDVTVSSSGAVWTIDNDAVTYAKMQNIAASRLVGRSTASIGDMEEITLGTNLSFTGSTLNAASGGGSSGQISNLFANASCQVAQRYGVFNLSTAHQIGQVDNVSIRASAGAVSAGTLEQNTVSICGSTANAARTAGTTLTGSAVISATIRMESKDAKKYKNKTVSLQVAVAHDVGSNVNYTLILKKADTEDDWSATTTIATGSATAVVTATGTILKLENQSIGDCSNGIEFEVQAACGAVTTKNFDFADFGIDSGATAPTFMALPFELDIAMCQRYLPSWKQLGSNAWLGTGFVLSSTSGVFLIPHPVKTRVFITGLVASAAADFSILAAGSAGSTGASFIDGGTAHSRVVIDTTGTMTDGQGALLYLNTGWLIFTGAELF